MIKIWILFNNNCYILRVGVIMLLLPSLIVFFLYETISIFPAWGTSIQVSLSKGNYPTGFT